MTRILVTGASGLLGLNFCKFFYRKYDLIGVANSTGLHNVPFTTITADLLQEDPAVIIDTYKPQIILHCAAMANIDKCEQLPSEAEEINSIFPHFIIPVHSLFRFT